jgi:hypothetical protein
VPELNAEYLERPRVQSPDEIEMDRVQALHDKKYGRQPARVVLSHEEEEREMSRLQAQWDMTHGKTTTDA